MVRVGVLGAAGRMGSEVCRAVDGAADLELVAAVDPSGAGRPLADLVGAGPPGLTVADSVAELARAGAEVAVDFTVAASARANLAWCAAHDVHAVVGTTGLAEAELDEVRAAFAASAANAVVAANFAVGAVLLMRLCELAAPHMEGIEVIELHHEAKRDAPSGTALATVERMVRARRAAGAPPLAPDPTELEVLAGARGAEGPDGIRVHAVRLPGLVAHQEVLFGATGQSLTVRHDAYDRRAFMPGVLAAVRAVARRPGLTVGLEDVLGI